MSLVLRARCSRWSISRTEEEGGGGGGGETVTVKKNCLARPSKKLCPKCISLKTSVVIWSDLGTFWRDLRIQNQSV